MYCHSGVTKSHYATIPAVETCMGCHKLVHTDAPEIKKLKQYYDEKRPVEWEPVNNLPEHAHFNHERHLKAGVGCQTCHGQINKMEVVEKVASLKDGLVRELSPRAWRLDRLCPLSLLVGSLADSSVICRWVMERCEFRSR